MITTSTMNHFAPLKKSLQRIPSQIRSIILADLYLRFVRPLRRHATGTRCQGPQRSHVELPLVSFRPLRGGDDENGVHEGVHSDVVGGVVFSRRVFLGRNGIEHDRQQTHG